MQLTISAAQPPKVTISCANPEIIEVVNAMRPQVIVSVFRDGKDGVDGYTPVKGVDYFDGNDGYTPVKGVDYFDGNDGYTPVKGVDYFDGNDGKDLTKRYEIEYEDNFYSASATASSTFTQILNGGVVVQQIYTSGIFTPPSFDSTTGNLLQLSTGASATGLASMALGSSNNPGTFFPGQGEFMVETKVTFPLLSTPGESFMYMFGLHTTGNIVSNDVISFKYDPERIFAFGAGPISANLMACTTQLTNRTFTDTGVVVNINQWYWLKIIINPSASEVRFYVDEVLVATHTTNITLTGKYLVNAVRKGAGTSPRLAHLRYMYFGHTPTNPIR